MFSEIIFLLVSFVVILCKCSDIRVRTLQGEISGTQFKLYNGKEVYGFLGIPYAHPPVLEFRFREPQPYPQWTGTWNGTQFTRFCIQYNNLMGITIGDEDCLYLNVFTSKSFKNAITGGKLMDVVVWFHGGSFIQGSANFVIPEYLLADHDVVYVGVNYRLGPFGFLSTDDHVVPGNNGLKDQVMALRWVRENVLHFGGNAESVTIAGSSAGASSVHFHLISPLSRGLFHKAIMHSGTSLQPWLLMGKTVFNVTTQHAQMLGCPALPSTEMIGCLRQRPAVRIASLNQETMVWRHLGLQYGPVIETAGSENFLTDSPISVIRKTRIRIPLLMSTTSDEGYIGLHNFIENESVLQELDRNFNDIAPYMLYYVHKLENLKRNEFGNVIRKHFFNGESITSKANYKQLVEMLGDRLIRAYVQLAIKEHARLKSGPIYFYKFHYAGQYSLTNKYANNLKSYGASHGDDMLYILRPQNQFRMTRPNDVQMTKLMTSIWASFMKNGKPAVNIEWPAVTSDDHSKTGLTYLRINSAEDLRIDHLLDTNAFEFWNNSLNEFPSDETMTDAHDEF